MVDTHAHLDASAYDPDRAEVVARALAAGVGLMVAVGLNARSTQASIQLAERYPQVYATAGWHPHDSASLGAGELAELARLSQHPRVVALGEMGLDFHRNYSPPHDQKRAFLAQLELARERNLPVIIHCRDAHEETTAILEEWTQSRPRDSDLGVIHCFGGGVAEMARYVGLGFYISFAGGITYSGDRENLAAVRDAPLSRLLVETDCPFLTPVPHRGQRNEPAYLPQVLKKVAQIRGQSPEEIARETTANARRAFRLPEWNSPP